MDDQDDQDRYIHLKEIYVDFVKKRPMSVLELIFKDNAGVKHKSDKFKKGVRVYWTLDIYIRTHTSVTLLVRRAYSKIDIARILVEFEPSQFGDDKTVSLEDKNNRITTKLVCGRSKSLADVALLLGSRAHATPPSKVTKSSILKEIFRLSEPQAHLQGQQPEAGAQFSECSSLTIRLGHIQWLNNDILLSIFNSYRLDEDNAWNTRLGWRKLSHVCRRWRHLIYELASHLGMHIECTNGTPMVNTLDHLPPLPLFVDYWCEDVTIGEQDASGIYHALLLHNRVRHIDLHLPPSIFHELLMLMGKPFPILEHLSLSFTDDKITTLTLPKDFLAPNLRHLALLGIGLPKRLHLLSSTVSLVTLTLTKIRASGFFRPRLLVARLQSLPGLEELSIGFSIPIPRPSAERELLGKQGILVTLLSLKKLTFQGVSAYLECLVAQIRTPLLEQLHITLFNQIVFTLPHLSHLIDITEGLKLPAAEIFFGHNEVSITRANNTLFFNRPFYLRVICKQLDWQIDCVAQICSALMPALSGVERLMLSNYYYMMMPEWRNGEIDGTTWHELLRSFTGVKVLDMGYALLGELSRALEAEGVGSDPRLLPSLQEIANVSEEEHADGLFGSFIQCRQVAGRPVRLSSHDAVSSRFLDTPTTVETTPSFLSSNLSLAHSSP